MARTSTSPLSPMMLALVNTADPLIRSILASTTARGPTGTGLK
jgi:hypothetical protein